MRTVKLNYLIIAILIAASASSWLLAYFFITKKPPVMAEKVRSAVAGNTDQKPPEFLYAITGKQTETAMKGPLSVAVARNGRVFVADTGNGRVQAYDPNGEFLFQFGREGPEESRLEMPVTLAWDRGTVYVGDIRRNAILLFDESGKYLRAISGRELGINLNPLAFAFDGDTLYVASGPGYIHALARDGTLTATIGKPGGPEGYLGYPNGIAVVDGKLAVADSNNQRIQVFSKDGAVLAVRNDLGLSLPRGVAVDKAGRLLVVDTFSHTVVALDKDLNRVFRFGDRGLEERQFNFPNQITIDDMGRIYIADRENNRIAVFGY